ncbi:MAG: alanine racemase [Parvicellaceae bacterium]
MCEVIYENNTESSIVMSTSRIEISQSALANNLDFVRKTIGAECELVAVIKGNAYGHGIEVFSSLLVRLSVSSFAVFSVSEAKRVNRAKTKLDRLIIMGAISKEELPWAILNNVEVFVFNWERLLDITSSAKDLGVVAKIHIELETGLNRTGFLDQDLEKLIVFIKGNVQFLKICGTCTHLAGAEDISNFDRIKQQIDQFNQKLANLNEQKVSYGKSHIACSAAVINYPKTILDMVRVGILLYGLWPSKEVKMAYLMRSKSRIDPLKRVISWKSYIMELKQVTEGEYVGYGTSFLAEATMTLAIVPVGYANGFTRTLSNKGKVLIRNTRVRIIGVINMNLIAVDVTNISGVSINDEVVLIGQQGEYEISLASFGDLSNQLNYELLTRLPIDIPREITG